MSYGPPMSRDPMYVQYASLPAGSFKPLGPGPAGYGKQIPRMTGPVDARSLGYADPRISADMQIARREGDSGGKPPVETIMKEGAK